MRESRARRKGGPRYRVVPGAVVRVDGEPCTDTLHRGGVGHLRNVYMTMSCNQPFYNDGIHGSVRPAMNRILHIVITTYAHRSVKVFFHARKLTKAAFFPSHVS